MKFQFIKQGSGAVSSYGGHVVKTDDIIDLDGSLAAKAARNPDYRFVDASELSVVDHDAIHAAEPEPVGTIDIYALRAEWEKKFGRKPHHNKLAETLRMELNSGD